MLQMRFSPSLNLLLLDVQCFGKFHLSESVKQHILNINSQYFLKYLLYKINDLSQARPAHVCRCVTGIKILKSQLKLLRSYL
jgi:hypothetical protein